MCGVQSVRCRGFKLGLRLGVRLQGLRDIGTGVHVAQGLGLRSVGIRDSGLGFRDIGRRVKD